MELSPAVVYGIEPQCPKKHESWQCLRAKEQRFQTLVMDWNDHTMAWSTHNLSNISDHAWMDYFALDASNPSLLAFSVPSSYPSYDWVHRLNLIQQGQSNRPANSRLTLPGDTVLNCRAEKVPESCTLNYNLSFALVVIVCNFIKVLTMSSTLWLYRTPTLITTGDAINSFLTQPDEMTLGLCLFSGASMHLYWEWETSSYKKSPQRMKSKRRRLSFLMSSVYKPERLLRGQSASPNRWIMCFILYLLPNPIPLARTNASTDTYQLS